MAYVSMLDLYPMSDLGKRGYYGPGSTGVAPPAGLNLAAEAAKAAATGSAPPVQQVTWQPATSVASALDPRTLQTQNTYIAQQMEKHWTPEQAAAQPVYQAYQQQQQQAEIDRLKRQQTAEQQFETLRTQTELQARAAEQQRLQIEARNRAQQENLARMRAEQEAMARMQAEQEAEYLRQVGAIQAAAQQQAYQQPAYPAYQQPLQPAYQQPMQPSYQQPAYQQPMQSPAQEEYVEEEVEDQSSNIPIIAAVVGGVFAVGALGFWIYTMRSDHGSNDRSVAGTGGT